MQFAQLHGLKIGTIADLIAYRRRYDHFIQRSVETEFQSHHGGQWRMMVYVNTLEYAEHIALVKGDITTPEPVLVRMHALNIFSDLLGYRPFERDVLADSMRIVAEAGRGVVVILRQTRPTFVSDVVLRRVPEDIDRRRVKEYGVGAQILLDLGREGHDPSDRHAGKEDRRAGRIRPQHRGHARAFAAREGRRDRKS